MPRSVVRSLGLAALYFVVLMALARTGFYPPVFRAWANFLFPTFGSGRIAKFEPLDDPTGMLDAKISVGSDSLGRPEYPSSLRINCVREGYTPIAVMIALGLATPIPWPRRWKALAIGLALVQSFVVLRIVVVLAYGFSRVGLGNRRLLEAGPLGSGLLHRADQILTGDLHLTFIAPILIWALVSLRPHDLRTLWHPAASASP